MVADRILMECEGHRIAFYGCTSLNGCVDSNYWRCVSVKNGTNRISGTNGDRTVRVGGTNDMSRKGFATFLQQVRQGADVERGVLLTGKDGHI
ncbi:MAG: hypothetical protein WC007_05130, partial [Pelobacteraceae bacterium]